MRGESAGRIAFLAEGQRSAGTGHLRRCVTLARSLSGSLQLQILTPPEQEGFGQATLAAICGELPWQGLQAPQLKGFSAVVLDVLPQHQLALASACRAAGVPCLALDYQQPSLLPEAVVALMDMSGAMRAAFAQAGRATDFHEGIHLAMLRPELRALARANRERLPFDAAPSVLVSLGGADPQGLTLQAIELLQPLLPRLGLITLVLGPAVTETLAEAVQRAAGSERFEVVRAPADFDQRLAAADLVLCNGGGTMLEALCLSRLTAILPQTEAEVAFARPLVEQGVCCWAADLASLLDMPKPQRHSLAQQAASRVDGAGVERIASILSSLTHPNS